MLDVPSDPRPDPAAADDEAPLLSLRVRLAGEPAGGPVLRADAAAGFRVVELLRAAAQPITAECGGAGVCGTCHIRIAESWRQALPDPDEDELARLDEIHGSDHASRLACRIVMTEALDGLELEIQPDSLDAAQLARRAAALTTD